MFIPKSLLILLIITGLLPGPVQVITFGLVRNMPLIFGLPSPTNSQPPSLRYSSNIRIGRIEGPSTPQFLPAPRTRADLRVRPFSERVELRYLTSFLVINCSFFWAIIDSNHFGHNRDNLAFRFGWAVVDPGFANRSNVFPACPYPVHFKCGQGSVFFYTHFRF